MTAASISNNVSILKYLLRIQNRQPALRAIFTSAEFFLLLPSPSREIPVCKCKYCLGIRSRAVISSLPPFSRPTWSARLFSHVHSPRSAFPTDKFPVDSSSNRGKMVSTMGCLERDNNDNNDANALHDRPSPSTRGERSYTKKSKVRGVSERIGGGEDEEKVEGVGEDGKLAN